ncbi:3-oxoacyl-[acyl-carrier-protein] reductase FabG [Papilio machaon]|uniref:3-oxoacyl-[acyl-carrier-protein] reductase FabG n=1 Tax=Papilio machaon TaxID=76193 RepID=A0A0N1PFW5_PAPMA|nr:3-oxoacyl-[acyl-carrier-protein] reductase FabG [Papilio machaon]
MSGKSFSNKVVFISGASSGIGAATAIEFTKEGANVVINGRNETKLKNVYKQCEAFGKKPLIIKADISKDEEAKAAIDETIKTFGKLDVLVNNAGFSRSGSILDGNLIASYDEIMATNVRGAMHLTALAAPHLIKTKGNIINISSVAGTAVPLLPQFISYCVSKAALDHFTRCSALELSKHGIRVNTVSPGPVTTDFQINAGIKDIMVDRTIPTALNRVSESIEIADVILFLASDKAKAITGSNYVSDNGFLLVN